MSLNFRQNVGKLKTRGEQWQLHRNKCEKQWENGKGMSKTSRKGIMETMIADIMKKLPGIIKKELAVGFAGPQVQSC